MPMPCGPPNLCGAMLRKSAAPRFVADSCPDPLRGIAKKGILKAAQSSRISRHGCKTPVSLFAAITATSAGGRVRNPFEPADLDRPAVIYRDKAAAIFKKMRGRFENEGVQRQRPTLPPKVVAQNGG